MRNTPTHERRYVDTPTPCSSPHSDTCSSSSSSSTDSTLSQQKQKPSNYVSDTDTEPAVTEDGTKPILSPDKAKAVQGNLGFSRSANWFGTGSGSECRASKRPGVGRCSRKPLTQRRAGGWEGQGGNEHGLKFFNIRVSKSCTKECEVLRPGHLYSQPFTPVLDSGSIYREIFRSSDSINDVSDLGVDGNDLFTVNASSPSNQNLVGSDMALNDIAKREEQGASRFRPRSSQLSLGLDSSAEGDSWNDSDEALPQETVSKRSSAGNIALPAFSDTEQLSELTAAERKKRTLDAVECAFDEEMSARWRQAPGQAHPFHTFHTCSSPRIGSSESKVSASTPLSSETSITPVGEQNTSLGCKPETLVANVQDWSVGSEKRAPYPSQCASEPSWETTTRSGLESHVAREAAARPSMTPTNLSRCNVSAPNNSQDSPIFDRDLFSKSTNRRTHNPGGVPLPTEIEEAISTAMRKGLFHVNEDDRHSSVQSFAACEAAGSAASSCSLNHNAGSEERNTCGRTMPCENKSADVGSTIILENEVRQKTNWITSPGETPTENRVGFMADLHSPDASVAELPTNVGKQEKRVPGREMQNIKVDLELAVSKIQVTVPTRSPAENNSNNKGGLGDVDSSPPSPDTKSCEEVASILLSLDDAPSKERASQRKIIPASRHGTAWAEGSCEGKSRDKSSVADDKVPACERPSVPDSSGQEAATDGDLSGMSPRLAPWIPAPEYLGFLDTLKRRHRSRREKKIMFRKKSPRVSPDGEPLNMVMEFQDRDLSSSPPAFPKGHECPADWRPGEHSDNYITQLSAQYKTDRLRDLARRRRKMNLRKRKKARSPVKKADSVCRESRCASSAPSLIDSNTEDGNVSCRSIGKSTCTTLTGRSDDVSSASELEEVEYKKAGMKGCDGLDSDTKETRRRGRSRPKRITSEVTLLKTLENYYQLSDDSNSETETAPIHSASKLTSKDGISTRMSCSLPLIGKSREKNAKAVSHTANLISLQKHSDLSIKLSCKLPLIKRSRPRTPKTGIRISKMHHQVPSIMDNSRLRELGARDQVVTATCLEETERWDYNIELAYKEEEEEGEETAAAKHPTVLKKPGQKSPSGKRGGKKSGGVKSGRGQSKFNTHGKSNASPKIVTYLDVLFPQRARAWGMPSQQSDREEQGLRQAQATEGSHAHNFISPVSKPRENPAPNFQERNIAQGEPTRFMRQVTRHQPEPRSEQSCEQEAEGSETKSRPKVVRFADQTRQQDQKSLEWTEDTATPGEEDDEWCYSVNAMLLRAKQVGGASKPTQPSDHKFPRPESANVIPPLLNNQGSSSSFLSELLKQDMMERRQAAKTNSQVSPRSNKSNRSHAHGQKTRSSNNSRNNSCLQAKPKVLKYIEFPSELPLNSFPNLPANSQGSEKASAAVLTIKTKLSKRAQERALRVEERNTTRRPQSPHYSPPTPESLQEKRNLVGVRYVRPIDMSSHKTRNLERETVRLLKDQAIRGIAETSSHPLLQKVAQPPKPKSPELSSPRRRSAGPRPCSYLLEQQSDTFKYFRSPHLQHRRTSVVQLYSRNDSGNINYNCNMAGQHGGCGRESAGYVRLRCAMRGYERKRKRCFGLCCTQFVRSIGRKTVGVKYRRLNRNVRRQYIEKDGVSEMLSTTTRCNKANMMPLLSDQNNNATSGQDSQGSEQDSEEDKHSGPRPVSTHSQREDEADSHLHSGAASTSPRPHEEEAEENISSWEVQFLGHVTSWDTHDENWAPLADNFLQVPNTSRASSRGSAYGNRSLWSAGSEQKVGITWTPEPGDPPLSQRRIPVCCAKDELSDTQAPHSLEKPDKESSDMTRDDVKAQSGKKPEGIAAAWSFSTSQIDFPGPKVSNSKLQANHDIEMRDQQCESYPLIELVKNVGSMQTTAAAQQQHPRSLEEAALCDKGVLNAEPADPQETSCSLKAIDEIQSAESEEEILHSHKASEEMDKRTYGAGIPKLKCETELSCLSLPILGVHRHVTSTESDSKGRRLPRRLSSRNQQLKQPQWPGTLYHHHTFQCKPEVPHELRCFDMMVTGKSLLPPAEHESRRRKPGRLTGKQNIRPAYLNTTGANGSIQGPDCDRHIVGRIQRVENILDRQRNALDTRKEIYAGSKEENEEEKPQTMPEPGEYQRQMEIYQKVFDDFHEEFWQHDMEASDRFCWKKVIVPPPFSKAHEQVEVSAQSSTHSWKRVFHDSCRQSMYTSTEGGGDNSEHEVSPHRQQDQASSNGSDNEMDFFFPPSIVASKVNSFRQTKNSKRFIDFACASRVKWKHRKIPQKRKNRNMFFSTRTSKNKQKGSTGKERLPYKCGVRDKETQHLYKHQLSSQTQIHTSSQRHGYSPSSEAILEHPGCATTKCQLDNQQQSVRVSGMGPSPGRLTDSSSPRVTDRRRRLWGGMAPPQQPFPTLSFLQTLRTPDIVRNILLDSDMLLRSLHAVTRKHLYLPTFRLKSSEPVADVSPVLVQLLQCSEEEHVVPMSKWECEPSSTLRSMPVFFTQGGEGEIESIFTVGRIFKGLYSLEDQDVPESSTLSFPEHNTPVAKVKAARLVQYPQKGLTDALRSKHVILVGSPTLTQDEALDVLQSTQEAADGRLQNYLESVCGWQFHISPSPSRTASNSESFGTPLSDLFDHGADWSLSGFVQPNWKDRKKKREEKEEEEGMADESQARLEFEKEDVGFGDCDASAEHMGDEAWSGARAGHGNVCERCGVCVHDLLPDHPVNNSPPPKLAQWKVNDGIAMKIPTKHDRGSQSPVTRRSVERPALKLPRLHSVSSAQSERRANLSARCLNQSGVRLPLVGTQRKAMSATSVRKMYNQSLASKLRLLESTPPPPSSPHSLNPPTSSCGNSVTDTTDDPASKYPRNLEGRASSGGLSPWWTRPIDVPSFRKWNASGPYALHSTKLRQMNKRYVSPYWTQKKVLVKPRKTEKEMEQESWSGYKDSLSPSLSSSASSSDSSSDEQSSSEASEVSNIDLDTYTGPRSINDIFERILPNTELVKRARLVKERWAKSNSRSDLLQGASNDTDLSVHVGSEPCPGPDTEMSASKRAVGDTCSEYDLCEDAEDMKALWAQLFPPAQSFRRRRKKKVPPGDGLLPWSVARLDNLALF